MRTDLVPFDPGSKAQEIQQVFEAYRTNKNNYKNPSMREFFGDFLWETVSSRYESPSHAAMVHYAGRLRGLLNYGTLLRLIPNDQSGPLDVVIGRRQEEFSVTDVNGVSIYKNGQDGEFIKPDRFIELSKYKSIRILDTNFGARN